MTPAAMMIIMATMTTMMTTTVATTTMVIKEVSRTSTMATQITMCANAER